LKCILKNHNHELFEIHIFYNKKVEWNAFTHLNLKYHYILDLSDEKAADLINSCYIDILFDFSVFTAELFVAVGSSFFIFCLFIISGS
jgi:predicted O-linked N-acetylglucosamine transferase (SPINDLY family)